MVVTLFSGMEVDVFGTEQGRYLAPTGTPYADRAIPPQTLDDPSHPADCEHLNFEVLHPFRVQSGPIARASDNPASAISTSWTRHSSQAARATSTSCT
jgi:hypothetical protein